MYNGSGAGAATMWIMMNTVLLGYMVLAGVAFSAYFFRSRTAAGPFVRFPEQDREMAMQKRFVADLEPMWRRAFIGKVYTLLCMQILITVVICFGMMQIGGYDFYVWSLTEGAWTRMVAMLSTFVILIAMMCLKSTYPTNLVLLFSFTVAMSYTLGVICTAYAAAGLAMLVLEAFAITSLLFVALTVFTMWSKIDFSFLGVILPMLLFMLIIWGFFAMFAFPSFAFSQVYALAGTVIFSLYVLFDTYMITTYLTYDDYVLGAINLYLDFVNLFLMILQLLMGMRRD
jgi:hypothetical protein